MEVLGEEIRTVEIQQSMSDPSPGDLDSEEEMSPDSLGAVGSPSICSRLSVIKVCSVFSKFSMFKRELAKEIGFDGMLDLKSWQKINLKYSAYLMDRLDPDASVLNLESQGSLILSDQSVHSVFGLPCGQKQITAEGVDPSESCIEYTRVVAMFSDKGTHSLKAAEFILLKEISKESSKIEKDCFKIALVVFVVGHVLAPSAKHDYITIDFWAALNNMDEAGQWNWCGYVVKHLFSAVRKFKGDVSKRIPTIHIVGCHIFLQVFVLDHLDLGELSKSSDVHPRIGLYDYESAKKMVDKVAVNIGGGEISFHGAEVRPSAEHGKGNGRMAVASYVAVPSPANKRVVVPCTPLLRASYAKLGPQEFSNHLRTHYPSVSGEKLGILLREQNARGLANAAELRQAFQSSMFNFADKVVACIADNCTCCKSAGRKQCILKMQGATPTNNVVPEMQELADINYQTPVTRKTGSHPDTFSGCGESSAAHSGQAYKRVSPMSIGTSYGTLVSNKKICVDQPQFDYVKDGAPKNDPLNVDSDEAEIARSVYNYYDDLTALLVTYYAELRPAAGFVLFGTTIEAETVRTALPVTSIAREPWAAGSLPAPPSPTVLTAIHDWFSRATSVQLDRTWILHAKPRMVSLSGIHLQHQLTGQDPLTHEMGVVLMRRLGQIDQLFSKEPMGMVWRKFLDPDFATTVLSNADPVCVHSVQKEFTSGIAETNPASCRMWYILATLEDGWALYSFDMVKKKIIVLDPAVGPFGYSTRRVKMHTYVSNKLHAALFRCINHFFSSWICTAGGWSRSFPILMVEKVSRHESGLCSIFFAKNYDGDKLVIPLTRENMKIHKQIMLFELMRLEGNESLLPQDALQAIKNSFCIL